MKKFILLFLLWPFMAINSSAENNALNFDGYNDYVQLGSLNLTSFTTMVWVNPTVVNKEQSIASTLSEYYKVGSELSINASGCPRVIFYSGGVMTEVVASSPVTAGEWVHLAVTFDGSTCYLYVNGIQKASAAIASYSIGASGMVLGRRLSTGCAFKGTMDEFSLWSSVLLQADIEGYMNSSPTGNEANLKACYHFNQGVAGGSNSGIVTLTDATSNANDGTLKNFAVSGAISNWIIGIQPIISVLGNGNSIDNGTSPSVNNYTHLGYLSTITGSTTRTFKIKNTGQQLLLLTDISPYVTISGANADVDVDVFSITTVPASSVKVGDSTTFDVAFTSSVVGVYNAQISIANSCSVSPFRFSVRAEVKAVPGPEIKVIGNSMEIADGDDSPSADDNTYFATTYVDSIAKTFTIENVGTETLNLTSASPFIAISGADADKFRVMAIPSSSIESGASTTFSIIFKPSKIGTYNAEVSIANNDSDKNLFSFSIEGNAILGDPGTKGNPYKIRTLDSLLWLSQNSTCWGSYFIQTADIDATDTKSWNDGNGFSPIGNETTKFTGHYNGKGHVIQNLTINRPSTAYVGFFGYTYGSTVDSLGLKNISATGANYTGGLVGWNSTGTVVFSCFTTGTVLGTQCVGGIAGMNQGSSTVSNCYNTCNVSGTYDVGGVVGTNHSQAIISSCFNTGNIRGGSYLGGLAGESNGTSIVKDCYSTGSVNGTLGTSEFIGGLVGLSNGAGISNGYSTGDVEGVDYVGGFVGWNLNASVSNCYSSGSVKGTSDIGGFIGWNSSSTVNNCFWDTQNSGRIEGIGFNETDQNAAGMKTDAMKRGENFVGWDFVNTWAIRADSTYPSLQTLPNNAPFAFTDKVIKRSTSIALFSLLTNDFDYEILQSGLTIQVDSLSAGSITNGYLNFPEGATLGDIVTIGYRVGEIRSVENDTLWGSRVYSTAIYGNNPPALVSVKDKTIKENSELVLSINDVAATDNENDELALVINGGTNYSVVNSTITPTLNYNGTLSVPIAVTDGIDTSNVLTMTVNVTKNVYTIVASAGNGGSISPSGSVSVEEGNDLNFTITANAGYRIADVLVDNVSVGSIASYSFSGVVANHTIAAAFSIGDGIETNEDSLVSLYPNPASSFVTIKGGMGIKTITVCSLDGRVLLSVEYSSPAVKLDIQNLQSGCYIIFVQTSSYISKHKLIKH